MKSKQSALLIFFINAALTLSLLSTVSSCDSTISTAEPRFFSEIFPSATATNEISLSEDLLAQLNLRKPKVTKIKGPTGIFGYCVESEVVSRSGPFRIQVLVDRQLYVKQASVISYPWQRGRDVQKRSFTRQFEGKGIGNPIEVGRDIDAVTGATISSRVMTDGVRESIALVKILKEKHLYE